LTEFTLFPLGHHSTLPLPIESVPRNSSPRLTTNCNELSLLRFVSSIEPGNLTVIIVFLTFFFRTLIGGLTFLSFGGQSTPSLRAEEMNSSDQGLYCCVTEQQFDRRLFPFWNSPKISWSQTAEILDLVIYNCSGHSSIQRRPQWAPFLLPAGWVFDGSMARSPDGTINALSQPAPSPTAPAVSARLIRTLPSRPSFNPQGGAVLDLLHDRILIFQPAGYFEI